MLFSHIHHCNVHIHLRTLTSTFRKLQQRKLPSSSSEQKQFFNRRVIKAEENKDIRSKA